MENEFREFGEAACLYARYSGVVDEMWSIFLAELASFFDAVKERMRSKLTAGLLQEQLTPSGRVWWISDEETEFDDVPYVWMDPRKPQIIDPGLLEIEINLDSNDEAHKQHIAAIQTALQLPPYCKIVKKGRIFGFTITYGKDDPVSMTAEPILTVLVLLYEAERKWRLAKSPKSRKGR